MYKNREIQLLHERSAKNAGILPQYAHLRGIKENMPVIRRLLGMPEHGNLPDNFIGRAVQRFVDSSREDVLPGGTPDK